MALVHVITTEHSPDSMHLSILPSLLSRLPPSINMLRISLIISRSWRTRDLARPSSKLSYLSLERVEDAVDKDGAINVCITINTENVSVTVLAVEGHTSSVERDVKSKINPLAFYGDRTFPFVRENAIFAPIASYSEQEGFTPISDDESSTLPSLPTASIIQLSVPPPDAIRPSISGLPVELLSLIFSFSDSIYIVADVCGLWREVSAPYWGEPDSLVQKYELLKRYPGAGRLWNELRINKSIDVEMVKEVIAGSPNVTRVWVDMFWNEEEARIVLNAIESLNQVNDVRFGRGSRKWRKDEIEDFMRRMGDRIRLFRVYDVESAASATAGLHLSSHLEHLNLYKYPPLSSLFLPCTLQYLSLSNLCPLPSSILDYPLPPLLERLKIELAPFPTGLKISILPTPLDFTHLTHLTELILDGGEETSNLIPRHFFSTLQNATSIKEITVKYCVVYSLDFPDFIRWFFGNWQMRRVEKRDPVVREEIGWHLEVCLFFGEWMEEEMVIARSTMKAYKMSKDSGVWDAEKVVEWWP
ncbi:hypothetical protein BT69DRAFT_1294175 [Atractiella rhizophila]|nr:hypothetical protein BT69DRAFT_1294175 [Atractiella rhizophila]